jgi:hypothetical protein
MATDNTTLNTGTGGDVVRDLARGGGSVKTQVVQLDVGGPSANTEQLVSNINQLPTADATLAQAQTNDSPIFVVNAGDPSGDFAGVNILEQVVSEGTGIALGTRVVNWPKTDGTPANALVLSDCYGPISVGPLYVGGIAVIDTTGYNTVFITNAALAATISWSNDLVNFSAGAGSGLNINSVATTTFSASTTYAIPRLGRYLKITSTTAGTSTVYLANQPYSISPGGTNLLSLNGTALVNAGVNGILSVGGNIADGSAPTANPLVVGGWERTGNTTRRLLVDAVGGVVLGASTQNNGQSLATYTVFSSTTASSNTLVIKAGAGRLTSISITQANTQTSFLHICNSTTVTTGTTASVLCYALPATIGTQYIPLPDGGMYFSTGISCYLSGAIGSTDNTAVGGTPSVLVNASYI